MAVRVCTVSFVDVRGIRHSVDVDADSLFEAAVLAVRRFRQDPWIATIGPTTHLDVAVREPGTAHAITLQQVEKWLGGASASPGEASRKAKLKTMLLQGERHVT